MIGWEAAWSRALYGPAGFYRRPEGPAGHFRTATHAAAPELAAALHRLARDRQCTSIVDVGAGRGELLAALAARGGLDLHGVDVVGRPPDLPGPVGWTQGLDDLPDPGLEGALVVGWELLDVVPGPVLEVDGAGRLREVLVEPVTGREVLGAPAGAADSAWVARWWPDCAGEALEEGDRVEPGTTRDRFWAGLVTRARAAGARALLAVDYAHSRADRPPPGSLTGYRAGRAVPPVPDGSMDLTTHVALDSVAAAGTAAGARSTRLTDQGTALRELGVTRGELLDPGALGGFGWLLQAL